jgi:hypothetical protein
MMASTLEAADAGVSYFGFDCPSKPKIRPLQGLPTGVKFRYRGNNIEHRTANTMPRWGKAMRWHRYDVKLDV